MSGHSKWSKVKRQKAVTDVKKGQVFTKLLRQITLAAQNGGGDPEKNPALRIAVDKARYARMPSENIERAIKRGAGETGTKENLEEIILEGYGPAGVAFLVECITDNHNRTVSEMRRIFSQAGGSLGEAGCTAYIFADREKPIFMVSVEDEVANKVMSLLDMLRKHEDVQEVYSNIESNLKF